MTEPTLLPLRDRLLGLASKHAANDWPELQCALQEAADEIERLRTWGEAEARKAWEAEAEIERLRTWEHANTTEASGEIERLRAALQEIANNKLQSRSWLEARARRALGLK